MCECTNASVRTVDRSEGSTKGYAYQQLCFGRECQRAHRAESAECSAVQHGVRLGVQPYAVRHGTAVGGGDAEQVDRAGEADTRKEHRVRNAFDLLGIRIVCSPSLRHAPQRQHAQCVREGRSAAHTSGRSVRLHVPAAHTAARAERNSRAAGCRKGDRGHRARLLGELHCWAELHSPAAAADHCAAVAHLGVAGSQQIDPLWEPPMHAGQNPSVRRAA